MRVWRMVDEKFLEDAWSGAGARLYGGRWNAPGQTVDYASEHPALAVLETMAGGIRPSDLKHFRLLSADVPDECVVEIPSGGNERERGDRWLATKTLACRVPSVVVPGSNVLLNPASPDWRRVRFQGETVLDPRLWQ